MMGAINAGVISAVVLLTTIGAVGVVLALLSLFLARSTRGGRHGRAGALSQDELRLVQEIHSQMGPMEKRIEALETILLEKMK